MKDSSTPLSGQPPVDPFVLSQIQQLCDFMQMLRTWWEHFEVSLRQLDQTAAIKAHDLIVEGFMVAKQVARSLGIVLPSVEGMNWSLSPRLLPDSGSDDL